MIKCINNIVLLVMISLVLVACTPQNLNCNTLEKVKDKEGVTVCADEVVYQNIADKGSFPDSALSNEDLEKKAAQIRKNTN